MIVSSDMGMAGLLNVFLHRRPQASIAQIPGKGQRASLVTCSPVGELLAYAVAGLHRPLQIQQPHLCRTAGQTVHGWGSAASRWRRSAPVPGHRAFIRGALAFLQLPASCLTQAAPC